MGVIPKLVGTYQLLWFAKLDWFGKIPKSDDLVPVKTLQPCIFILSTRKGLSKVGKL